MLHCLGKLLRLTDETNIHLHCKQYSKRPVGTGFYIFSEEVRIELILLYIQSFLTNSGFCIFKYFDILRLNVVYILDFILIQFRNSSFIKRKEEPLNISAISSSLLVLLLMLFLNSAHYYSLQAIQENFPIYNLKLCILLNVLNIQYLNNVSIRYYKILYQFLHIYVQLYFSSIC